MGLDILKIDVTSSVDSDLAIQAGQLSKLPVEPKIFSDMVDRRVARCPRSTLRSLQIQFIAGLKQDKVQLAAVETAWS